MEVINQKEYLKKYLSGKKDKKKKKRKKNEGVERVKIIDDDIDLSKINSADAAEDLYNTNEDAPQIVGVIDDRPMHMRIDDYRQSDLWRPLGASTSEGVEADFKESMFQKEKEILLKLIKKDSVRDFKSISLNKLQRGKRHKDKNDSQITRWNIGNSSRRERSMSKESDVVSQGNVGELNSPSKRSTIDADNSPPRKGRRLSENGSPVSTIRDSSPPRRSRKNSDSGNDDSQSFKMKSRDSTPSRRSRQKDMDSSPPRKSRRTSDSSPPRKSHLKNKPEKGDDTDINPKRKLLPGDKKGKYLIPAKRMTKTLDGKTAGLQNARELVNENEAFRKREDDLFKNLSADVSGANATTVLRDRKTGKIRDLKKEEEQRLEKQKQEEANKEKYSRWGKGLKQVEAYENKLQEDVLEMNKPLARYADDEDLERYLREQERDGDPMLDYIRKKRRKNDVESGKPIKPKFEGEFMPNRFGIRPGHRWDGVDRSNGYEKKWIDVQNAKHAIQEEVYKWSTEDM
ncbi:hypothetical protein RN001_015250 [Aquatica leii]|uniref:BUD13 homolog n=1 Tax=Aquatica leii TaxID=1421715 RepID=A0AAN7P0S4_9COLE|nr:hypothetical protein RN001_015250 [Aquatica leii]